MSDNQKKRNGLENLPLLPLRGAVAYPNVQMRFDIGREGSLAALELAMQGDARLMAVTQRDAQTSDPRMADLYGVGTIIHVRQAVQLPDGTLRVLADGERCARLVSVADQGKLRMAVVRPFLPGKIADGIAMAARMRVIKKLAHKLAREKGEGLADLAPIVQGESDAAALMDALAYHLLGAVQDQQRMLEIQDLMKRAQWLLGALSRESAILKLERSIQEKVHENIDQHQREYYLNEQIKAIRSELGDEEEQEKDQLRRRLSESAMNETAREKIETEFKRLSHAAPGSPEGAVSLNYIEYLLDLPWGVRSSRDIHLPRAKAVLERDHSGLASVKERILEFLAVTALKGDLSGPILCLVGPPGVGKTSIARSIADALGRKFVRLSLGGLRDEAEIRGHRRTYIGAIPGRIIAGVKQAGCADPLFLLDEIDKLSSDFRGDPASALLEALDPQQNQSFSDSYLEAPFDLSNVLFITTANTTDSIPSPLLDRMEVLRVPGYTLEEKAEIARRHLWPKQLKAHGMQPARLKISKRAIYEVIDGYTREAGVRSLERELGSVIRKAAVRWLETPEPQRQTIRIGVRDIASYLGARRYTREDLVKEPETGLVNGLAWTSAGGETLSVEVVSMPGSGKLDLTGQLGDVMQESARAALSYIRSTSEALHIPPDFYKSNDLHVHVPEGATPKDGPSAGVALTCAMVSAITRRPARQDVAMTGEVTLRGRVLPIGGVKEKLLAAHRVGIREVLLPAGNAKDLDELPKDVRDQLRVNLIGRVEQALHRVLM